METILSLRELCTMARDMGLADSPVLLTDNAEVYTFPRLVDVYFRFGRVCISVKTCIMVDDMGSVSAPRDAISYEELLRYASQYGFADKPLVLSDSSGLGYYVTDAAPVVTFECMALDISVCFARRI